MAYKRIRVTARYRLHSERLMDQVREVLRYHHYAIRTEQAYVSWILQFSRFNGKLNVILRRWENRRLSGFYLISR
jgi:hypothetical protein